MVEFFLEEIFLGILYSNFLGPVVEFFLDEMISSDCYMQIYLDQWSFRTKNASDFCLELKCGLDGIWWYSNFPGVDQW